MADAWERCLRNGGCIGKDDQRCAFTCKAGEDAQAALAGLAAAIRHSPPAGVVAAGISDAQTRDGFLMREVARLEAELRASQAENIRLRAACMRIRHALIEAGER